MFHEVLYFALISTAFAAVYIDGPCPDVKPVDFLDLSIFVGSKWYEIARYPNDVEKKGDCGIVSFNKVNDDITFAVSDVINGKPNKVEGKVTYAPNAGTSGILNYKSKGFIAAEATDVIPVYFVAVDEDKYCIGYECRYNEKTNKSQVFAWIKSRTKKLEGDAKTAVDKFIQSAPYINSSLFYWDKFDDAICNLIV